MRLPVTTVIHQKYARFSTPGSRLQKKISVTPMARPILQMAAWIAPGSFIIF
jgi:hypothetical protein